MPISDQKTSRLNSGTDYRSKALKTVGAVLSGIALAVLVSACAPSFGDPAELKRADKAEKMADEMVNKLDKKVKLTYTKIAKVREILIAYYKKRPGPMGKEGGPPPGEPGKPDKKMTEREKDLELELSVVLNKKEMAAYKELMREQKEEMKKHRPGGGPSGPPPGKM
jgi:hypothetical protein